MYVDEVLCHISSKSWLGVIARNDSGSETSSFSPVLFQDKGDGVTLIVSGAPCEIVTLGLGDTDLGENIPEAFDFGVFDVLGLR